MFYTVPYFFEYVGECTDTEANASPPRSRGEDDQAMLYKNDLCTPYYSADLRRKLTYILSLILCRGCSFHIHVTNSPILIYLGCPYSPLHKATPQLQGAVMKCKEAKM